MEKIKPPLIGLSTLFGIGFLDGFLSLGLSDDVYFLVGVGAIVCTVWMWIVVSKNS